MKLVVVTIVDNDQRVNAHINMCTANCSNEHFDLGTKEFPLNEKIEIEQGFIDVLKQSTIPHHVKDPKTGLNVTRMRKRYSIQ